MCQARFAWKQQLRKAVKAEMSFFILQQWDGFNWIQCKILRAGQNHIIMYTVCIQYYRQGNQRVLLYTVYIYGSGQT